MTSLHHIANTAARISHSSIMTTAIGESPRRRIIVFARAPERGRVKTRLAAEIGDAAALEIYRWLGGRTLEAARARRTCELEVRYTPATGTESVAQWLGLGLQMRPQSDGNLGERMRSAIAEALHEAVEHVVLIGTDCPTLESEVIEHAFDELTRTDVVLGPAHDGGYYLIATRGDHGALFQDIPWSASDTLSRTVNAAKRVGLRTRLLDTRDDIDTADDWRRFVAAQRRLSDAAPGDSTLAGGVQSSTMPSGLRRGRRA